MHHYNFEPSWSFHMSPITALLIISDHHHIGFVSHIINHFAYHTILYFSDVREESRSRVSGSNLGLRVKYRYWSRISRKFWSRTSLLHPRVFGSRSQIWKMEYPEAEICKTMIRDQDWQRQILIIKIARDQHPALSRLSSAIFEIFLAWPRIKFPYSSKKLG